MSKSTQQKPVKRIVVLCHNKNHAIQRARQDFSSKSLRIDLSKATVTFETEDSVHEYWMITVTQELRGMIFHEYLDWRDDILLAFVKTRISPFQPHLGMLRMGDWDAANRS